MKRFLPLFLVMFLGVFISVTAQELHPPADKYQQFVNDVYPNTINVDVTASNFSEPNLYTAYTERIVYVKVKPDEKEKLMEGLPKLSDIPVRDRFNSTIKRDVTFNPQTFNPFKYELPLHLNDDYYIMIDNTDYMIVIKSQ